MKRKTIGPASLRSKMNVYLRLGRSRLLYYGKRIPRLCKSRSPQSAKSQPFPGLSRHRACRCTLGLFAFVTLALFIFLSVPVPEVEYHASNNRLGLYRQAGSLEELAPPSSCQPNANKYPKIIHQIWLNYTAFPDNWNKPIESCRTLNKNYTYWRWSAYEINRFLEREYPWILATYKSYRYKVQQVDAARLFILYHYGGIYIDMDITCVTSFNDITMEQKDYDVILSRGTTFGVSNHIMLSKPRHPYLDLAIRSLPDYNVWTPIPYITIMYSAGPLFLTKVLEVFPCKDQIYVFPPEPLHNRYYVNMHGGSWHTWDTLFIDALGIAHKAIKRIVTWNGFLVCLVVLLVILFYNIKTSPKRHKKAKDSSAYRQISLDVECNGK